MKSSAALLKMTMKILTDLSSDSKITGKTIIALTSALKSKQL